MVVVPEFCIRAFGIVVPADPFLASWVIVATRVKLPLESSRVVAPRV